MDKRLRMAVLGGAVGVIIILILLGSMIIKQLTPSDEIIQLSDYYKVGDSEVLIILQDEIYDIKGKLIDGSVYVDYNTVIQQFNHRFYWDFNENVLTYTTPGEIIRAESDSKNYTVTKSMIETVMEIDIPIVQVFADQVYLSLEFVKKYSDLSYTYFENPSRVVINYKWGEYLFTEVTKETQLRTEPSIKSPIITELSVGSTLMYVDKEEAPQKGFVKVMTTDGVKGYVKSKSTKESYYETIGSSYQAPEYTAQTRPGSINLVFHQVFNTDAADNLGGLIAATKGVNVVSPTWFSVNDVSGTISSLATKRYVTRAKELGLEVWALVDDFNTEISMYDVLSHTSRRETLSNSLIQAALDYQLNGINIDFEKISSDAGVHYIQFLRELSVKCRNNGIVLSVDNYVPTPYTAHYDREEQGKVVDYVIVMAYDEFYAGSEVAGPVASISFVTDAVNNILELVPKEKTIIAIPFYTRLWKEVGTGEVSAESFAMTPASQLLVDNGVEAEWSNSYGCYYAEFKKDGATYKMWLEEEQSIEAKMKVIYDADVAGVAAWKLGLEKESIWNVITPYLK
jgi:spore germination protein YaaH